jgi:hypothetical protein
LPPSPGRRGLPRSGEHLGRHPSLPSDRSLVHIWYRSLTPRAPQWPRGARIVKDLEVPEERVHNVGTIPAAVLPGFSSRWQAEYEVWRSREAWGLESTSPGKSSGPTMGASTFTPMLTAARPSRSCYRVYPRSDSAEQVGAPATPLGRPAGQPRWPGVELPRTLHSVAAGGHGGLVRIWYRRSSRKPSVSSPGCQSTNDLEVPEERLELSRDFSRWILRGLWRAPPSATG